MHQQGVSFVKEHGPYAGVGFLQDLAVVQQSALSSIGIVGGQRSSTDLLTEWMEYERLVEYYGENADEEDDEPIIASSNRDDANQRRRFRKLTSRHEEDARPIPELPRCILPGPTRKKHD